MAIGGSFNKEFFTPQDPVQMMWARRMWDWDTQNPFAKGVAGVQGVQSQGIVRGRQSRMDLGVQAPVGQIQQAVARPVNMFASARNISAGGRDYGNQSFDRKEMDRFLKTGEKITSGISGMFQQANENQANAPMTPGQQRRQSRRLTRQGIPQPPTSGALPPPPPQPAPLAPPSTQEEVIPEPPQPAPFAPPFVLTQDNSQLTSAQRMANAQSRITEQQKSRTTPTTPLPQAVPSRPSAGFPPVRQVAQARPAQATPAKTYPQRKPSGLGPFGKTALEGVTIPGATAPAPTGLAGDQNSRLAAEGIAQPAPKKTPKKGKK